MRVQDAFGVGLSGLCLLHCLAVPLIVSVIPVFVWMENELIHISLACLALLVTINAVREWPAGRTGMMLNVMAALGIGLLFFGALSEVSEETERLLTLVGAFSLASAHLTAWVSTRHVH